MLTPTRPNQYHPGHIGDNINNNNTAENITRRRNRANNTTTTFNTGTDNSDNAPFLNNVSPTMSDLFSSPLPSQPSPTILPLFTDLSSTLTTSISSQSPSLSNSMSQSLSPSLQLPYRPREQEATARRMEQRLIRCRRSQKRVVEQRDELQRQIEELQRRSRQLDNKMETLVPDEDRLVEIYVQSIPTQQAEAF
ncbi:hypothetical protein BC941DRAFT_476140 [Chlamydoabsidia padenii]|nr:hypothetical protein BC941DRAFT_476140 [Chlamydoabsidia padenii]